MSNNKIFKISNVYMLLCGIDSWDRSFEINDVVDYIYLASIATFHNINWYTDIIFFWCQVK